MRELDSIYIENMKHWIENEKRCQEVAKNRINYLVKDIELSNQQLEYCKKALKFTTESIEAAQKELDDYLKNPTEEAEKE